VKILLDTQCWLWMVNGPERFSRSARRRVEDTRNELILSAACAMEIAIKYSIGKLKLHLPPPEFVPALMQLDRVSLLPFEFNHAIRLGALPFHHRDPFDRLLIAQAQVEGLAIMSADDRFQKYSVDLIDA
jgi:PIN domain nuclease of toxin-antitoxin system